MPTRSEALPSTSNGENLARPLELHRASTLLGRSVLILMATVSCVSGCGCSPYPTEPPVPRLRVEVHCAAPVAVALLETGNPVTYLQTTNSSGVADLPVTDPTGSMELKFLAVVASPTSDSETVSYDDPPSAGEVRVPLSQLELEPIQASGEVPMFALVRPAGDMCPPAAG